MTPRARDLVDLIVVAGFSAAVVAAPQRAHAQTAPAATTPKAAPAAAASAPKIEANLMQLMKGILYPAANVIFAAQEDLGKQPKPEDASTSPNPLTTTYGGWQAVENAALALAEATNLVSLPGRLCSNGKPVPIQRADWIRDVQTLRDAARATYKAAQTKNMDAIVDASGPLADACMSCHNKHRERKNGAQDRCAP